MQTPPPSAPVYDEVMSSTYGIDPSTPGEAVASAETPGEAVAFTGTPGEAPPVYGSAPPAYYNGTAPPDYSKVSQPTTGAADAAAVTAPVIAGGRKLVFIGVRNTVICRDLARKDPTGRSIEVWRREVGEVSVIHRADPYIVYSGGVVVVRFLKTLMGLDPLTGTTRWTLEMKEYGVFDLIIMVVSGMVVYVGVRDIIMAVSAVNGQLLWEYKFGHRFLVSVPSIICCGMSVLAICFKDMALLNAADGSVRWTAKFSHGEINRPATGAWDGENKVMLGTQGYVYPIDLRDGSELEKINLKKTGLYDVGIVYDNARRNFYAFTNGTVFAISAAENQVLWRTSLFSHPFSSFALEPVAGRIYVITSARLHCIDLNGKPLFSKDYDIPMFSRDVYAVTLDLIGSGVILVGSAGFYTILDADGNTVEKDELKGMRYGQTFLCTPTASIDENASCEVYHKYWQLKARSQNH